MHVRQRGFALVEVILAVLVISMISFVSWRLYTVYTQKVPFASGNPSTTKPLNPKRIVAIGDMVCAPTDSHASGADKSYCQDSETARLAKAANADAILALGDLQYEKGALTDFQNAFSKNWGDVKKTLYPAPGNHEYATSQAQGYYTYFQDAPTDVSKGYYKFSLDDWDIVSLKSNCAKIGGCGAGSEQLKWLQAELDKSQAVCSIAFWHHPRFTSGRYFGDVSSKENSDSFWAAALAHKVDIVLTGHDHLYERFAPQNASGQLQADGPRQFTVGTGGKSLYKRTGVAPNSERIIDDQYGVLILELYAGSYRWEFKSINGSTLDSGQQDCV